MSWINLTNIEFLLCSIFFHGFIWEQSDETESHENGDGWFGLMFRPFHRFFTTFYNSIIIIISLTFPLRTLNTTLWVKSWMYKEEEYEKLLIGHAFEICRLKRGDCRDVNHKMECTSISDDAVSGLRPTRRDVSSDLTDQDMAVWQRQRHLPSSQFPGDARYLRKLLTENRNT